MPSLKDVRQSLVAKVVVRKHVCKLNGLFGEEEEEEEKLSYDMSYVCMEQNTGLFRILKFPMPFGLCYHKERPFLNLTFAERIMFLA